HVYKGGQQGEVEIFLIFNRHSRIRRQDGKKSQVWCGDQSPSGRLLSMELDLPLVIFCIKNAHL
ncbi:hypothetical protein, partial [Enterobacter cloacae complex sp. 4DZ3-17B2]|uniref:hypothetical protein n=1 Tax=Enterobacter cloacae complex sp. 4DZ3-17B2 TaxID=2511990 RepID=UPI001CA56F5C